MLIAVRSSCSQRVSHRREPGKRRRRGNGRQGELRRFSPGRVGSSLRHRNYRLYFFGQLVSVMGTWMQTVAQSFLVLDLTHSGTDLGLVTAARFLPILVFGPAGGLFADRRNKRRILYVTQALSGVLAAIFAILTGTHVIQMWLVYVLALSLGFVNVFDNPARQSFISEMVPPDDLPNAVTLNSVSLNLARVFGGALGGVLTAVLGLALCFACNAISFIAVIASLAAMNGALLYPARPVKRMPGQIRQGLRYVRETPELLIPLLMIALVGTLAWEFQVTLPLMASKVFGGGAGSYGVMASVMGVGAVGGGLISASRGQAASALAVRGGHRLGHRDHGRRRRADAAARAGGARLCRLRQHHVQFLRQDDASAGVRARDAGTGHGAVGPGVAGLDPARRDRSSGGSRRTSALGGRWWLAGFRLSCAACSRCPRSPGSTGGRRADLRRPGRAQASGCAACVQGRPAMTARCKATRVSSSSGSASVLSALTQDLISSAVAPARAW